ncbi:MAG TPA: phosphoribosylanthranilate isomerase [Methylophilaceae bacterium]
MHVRTKICGITRIEDALAAVALGADAVGLVFHPKSPRAVGIQQAAAIVSSLPPFVTAVGLFVDAAPDEVRSVLSGVRLGLLQFHGYETAAYCEQFNMPYIKAVAVKPGLDLAKYVMQFGSAQGLLLDAYQEGLAGGTGQVFDWKLVPDGLGKPVILAGGLNAGNVAQAITQIHPYAVDVSGGVEREKGIKDAAKIAAFIKAVERFNFSL